MPIGLGYHSQVWRQSRIHEQVVRGKSGLEPSLVLLGWGWVWEAKMTAIREGGWLCHVLDRKVFGWIPPAFPG